MAGGREADDNQVTTRAKTKSRQKPSGRLLLVLLAIALSTGVACTTAHNPPSDDARSQARSQHARWEAAKITSYSWSNRLVTSWGSDLSDVTVLDGKPWKFLDNGKEASIQKDEEQGIIPLTVDDLFDVLDEGYAEGKVVTVTYDPTYGYPAHIHLSPAEVVSDSEYDVSVVSFAPQR